MQLILDQSPQVVAWAQRRMPIYSAGLKGCAAIGMARDGQIVAAAVFHDFRVMPFGKDIQFSFAAATPAWATRGNIRSILAYPFLQLGCNRFTAILSRKNKRGRKLLEGLGFRLEGVHRHGYDGKTDAISYAMYREEAARWLPTLGEERPMKIIGVTEFAMGAP